MRRSLLLAAAILIGASAIVSPAAAQQKGSARSPHAPAARPTASPAADVPTFDIARLAAAAKLDAATRARIAPHVTAMTAEMRELHRLTGRITHSTPAAQRDSIHKLLGVHYASFDRNWKQATAAVPPAQRAAFDAAVRQQMGVRGQPVGNPHRQLPASHPKLNKQGGPAKKK